MLPDMAFFRKTKDAHQSVDTLLGSYRKKNMSSGRFLGKRHKSVSQTNCESLSPVVDADMKTLQK